MKSAVLRRLIQAPFRKFRTVATPYAEVVEALDATLARTQGYARNAIVMVAQVDDLDHLYRQYTGVDVDGILRKLSDRMKGGILRRDMVRRLDGGQFAIVLSPLYGRSTDDVLLLAGQVQALLAAPLRISDTDIHVSVSIGCALARSENLETGADMLEAARIALVEARAQGPAGLRFYVAAMGEQVRERRALGKSIHAAMQSGDILAYFQPQIALDSRKVSGVEVLARWKHREKGLISPGVFLPILAEVGLMRSLGRLMLRDALRALAEWQASGLVVPTISINMCADELRDVGIVQDITKQLRTYNIAPERLVIEVLETVYAGDQSDPIIRNLALLAKLGCKIDLDDFGTGHASIKSVRNFSVARIKIDRSFITDVDHDPDQQQVVKTILSVAQNLSVATLAEGVETEAEIRHLAASGCGHAQGFAIAHPLPATEAFAWMMAHRAPEASAQMARQLH